jgi:hypothetical protein
MVEHPPMRPDLSDAQVPAEEITADDVSLNSLCEFDIAYCLIVAAMGTGRGSAYPSSAAFDEDRGEADGGADRRRQRRQATTVPIIVDE